MGHKLCQLHLPASIQQSQQFLVVAMLCSLICLTTSNHLSSSRETHNSIFVALHLNLLSVPPARLCRWCSVLLGACSG
ncbi:hypothetical protein UPYG_G00168730 [Umbra pygmaea]|uniref:Uncharacterized protein n=1 Tax=Umbra pygmaea TaxID=75934 RepID=A0ABD0WT66_UMBPY